MLKGLKVLELSSVLAGPAVGMFFAELGAEVTKIENPKTGGDVTRSWKSKGETRNGYSAYFSSVNWGKKHIMLDYSNDDDLEAAKALVKTHDVIIANFKFEDDEKFGLDFKSLSKINESIIYAKLIGFESDPSRPAFDAVLQAETGFMSMNGTASSGALKMPVALIDVLAAHQMKEAILLALLNKTRNGKGALIEVSLEKAALASLVNQATNYLMNDSIPKLSGSRHPNIAPYGDTFQCQDLKSIVLAVGSDAQFDKLCEVLDIDKVEARMYHPNAERVRLREQLCLMLSGRIKEWQSGDLMRELLVRKIPVGLIKDLREVLESPLAESMVLEEEVQGEITQRLTGNAFKISFNP